MTKYVLAAALIALPSAAPAQLSPTERARAEQLARIQAKADAEERANERRIQRGSAKARCSSSGRRWDYANDTCKPK